MPAIRLLTGLLLVLVTASVSALDQGAVVEVSYVSAGHVYVSSGRADGLSVGDRLAVKRDGQVVAEYEVVFVANHSASLKPTGTAVPLSPGDLLTVITAMQTDVPVDTAAADPGLPQSPPRTNPVAPPLAGSPGVPVRLYGSVSVLMYHWSDNSDADLDFTRSSARLNLRADNIWTEHLSLAVRTRGRYNVRNRDYAGVDRTEWENRLWVLSLTYDNPSSLLSMSAGRFLPRRLGSVGYLDGALVEARLSRQFRLAAFGGRQPEWAYRDDGLSLTRAGSYLAYESDPAGAVAFQQSVGGVVEYHQSEQNRSYVAATGTIRSGATWGMAHSLEIDVNTGWRKERAGESVTLSNLFLQSWIRLHPDVRTTLSYDNRKRYWTYEYRTVADSLFDERARTGVRGRIDVRLLRFTSLSGSIGFRRLSGTDEQTTSYAGSVRQSRFFGQPISLNLMVSGFDGEFEDGFQYTVQAQYTDRAIGQASISIGRYAYTINSPSSTRASRYVELGLIRDILQSAYISASSQWNSGDDIDGLRLQLELGYRYR